MARRIREVVHLCSKVSLTEYWLPFLLHINFIISKIYILFSDDLNSFRYLSTQSVGKIEDTCAGPILFMFLFSS